MGADIEKIDIIIPNKSNVSDLFKCLDSLNKNIDVKKYKIETIIVDDLSKKNERAELLEEFKKYQTLNIYPIFLNKHYGFTKALNTGLKYSLNKKSKPKYIAFLHNDTVIFENWLEDLIYQIETDVLTFGVGSITFNELESQCITNVYKKLNEKIDISEYYDSNENNIYEINQKIWNNNDKLEFSSIAFSDKISLFSSLFKTEAFEKFGIFNEDLISSSKVENEFCQRLIKNGKKIILSPKSLVLHKCRQLSFVENSNVNSYKKIMEATIFNMEIADSLNTDPSKHKNYVIYTFVSQYSEPPKFDQYDDNTDYICFTTDERVYGNRNKSYPWKIFDVEKIVNALEFPRIGC